MVMASIQIIIFRICTLSNDLCVRSYISCSIPSSRTVLFSLIISSLTPDFILSISLISHLVLLSRPVLALIPFPLSSGYASRPLFGPFPLGSSSLDFPREILDFFFCFCSNCSSPKKLFILLSCFIFFFRMLFDSGLACLGLTIFGSFEILAVLAYFAALHHFDIWTVSLVTGICVLGPTGYSLFRLITEIISYVKFHRGEDSPIDQRSKKQRILALSFIVSCFTCLSF